MNIYLRKDIAGKVNALSKLYPAITASNQGIIMMTTKEWSKVVDHITTLDDKLKEQDIVLDFLDCYSLWSECFCVYVCEEKDKSFWGIYNHETFIKVCKGLCIYPVVIPYEDIPCCFMKNFIYTEDPKLDTFEAIEFLDN